MLDEIVTPETANTIWIWGKSIGVGVLSILAVLGAKSLAPEWVKRKWSKRDTLEELHASNQGKAMDQDAIAFQRTDDRLTRLEERFDKLQADHNSLMVEHATVKAENEHLKEKLAEAMAESSKRGDRIVLLEAEVRKLQGEVAELIAIQRGEK
jgi:regulator of replication initiation timing